MKKRSKFWTVVFSFLPGAGHMFMGFMKLGVSLMSLFFAVIFLASWLQISPLLYVLPVLWFYSFFDCINKAFSSDEQFVLFEDHYLLPSEANKVLSQGIVQKHRLVIGIIVLLLGVYLVLMNVYDSFYWAQVFTDRVYSIIGGFIRQIPQLFIGVGIIVVGWKLIIGKKKECENDD